MSKAPKTPAGKQKAAALKHGWRSGLEEGVGKQLKDAGVEYRYEEVQIKWIDYKKRQYTPDFILPNGIIIETKGRFITADRQKHLKIKEQYPSLDIRFVFNNPNSRLSKVSKTMYRQWCDRYGFQWAAKEIPEDWLREPHIGFDVEEYIKKGC
jgi:hypothetical protein